MLICGYILSKPEQVLKVLEANQSREVRLISPGISEFPDINFWWLWCVQLSVPVQFIAQKIHLRN